LFHTDWRGSELHESRLRWQHPPEAKEEEWVISEGNHRLDHPKNCFVMTEKIFAERNVFFSFALQNLELKN
jgi:hypothetical protein